MRTHTWLLLLGLTAYASACRVERIPMDPEHEFVDTAVPLADQDGDGFTSAEDCDDQDPRANPAFLERCDGTDNDCDGETDETSAADASTWYSDADGDGYGDATSTLVACEAPDGYVADDTDCDDGDEGSFPSAVEICADGRVNDCDGLGYDSMASCGGLGVQELVSADLTLTGPAGNRAGWFPHTDGDLDMDGLDDVIIGTRGSAADLPLAYLVRGSTLRGQSGELALGDADLRVLGSASTSGSWAVAGWQVPDASWLAVGFPQQADGAGQVLLFDALASGEQSADAPDVTLSSGASEVWWLGYGVSNVGDVTGDGVADLALSAPGVDGADLGLAGTVYVMEGAALTDSMVVLTESATATVSGLGSARAGYALGGACDVNADGFGDTLIGTPGYGELEPGVLSAANVLLGPVDGSLEATDGLLPTTTSWPSAAGFSIACAGDVSGDGVDDVVLGAWVERADPDAVTDSGIGAAYVLDLSARSAGASFDLSSALLARIDGDSVGQKLGASVMGAGDLDLDQRAEIVIGAWPGDGADARAAFMFVGADLAAGASFSPEGAAASYVSPDGLTYAGASLGPAGDINGDGLNDILIGDFEASISGSSMSGAAYLFFGGGY